MTQMKTKTSFLLCASVLALMFLVSFAVADAITHTETFDNSGLTGTYQDNFFVGDDEVTWNYEDARDEGTYSINGAGIIFRDTNGKIYSETLSTGISDFSVKLKKGSATAGDRQVELFINDVSKGLSEVFDDDDTHTFTVNGINVEEDIVIEIRNIQDVHVVLDDITWSEYSSPTQEDPEEIEACELTGNAHNNLKISGIDFSNQGFGSEKFGDDDEWFPLDEIEVEIEIENKGDEKIEDIEVEWGLYNVDANEWVKEIEDEKDFNLKDGKEEVITISFKLESDLDIDLDELVDGDTYKFYVIANGYDTEYEEDVCAYEEESIEMIIEDDFVVLYDIQFSETVSCGTEVQLTAEVWNIGDNDQEDVSVKIYNSDLGINEMVEIGDIDSFDKEDLDFILSIPEDAEEKNYPLDFSVYDEDEDVFQNDYDDQDSEFRTLLTVEGSCKGSETALVSANLETGGKAGQEMVVRATITNTGDDLSTFTLNAAAYTGWASSVSLDASTIVLGPGESKDVLFTFDVKKDALAVNTFDIEIVSNGELVIKQPVSITIEPSAAGFEIGDNWYLWGIALLNIILVIIIIIVAVKVAKK